MHQGRIRPQWDGDSFTYSLDGETYRVDCGAWTRQPAEPTASLARPGELLSPNTAHVAFVRNHDVWVRSTTDDSEKQLTTDGRAHLAYATPVSVSSYQVLRDALGLTLPPLAVWSGDSTRLLTHRIDETQLEHMHLVRSSPPSGGRPELISYPYAMPGDPHVATAELVILTTDGERIPVHLEPFPVPYMSPIALRQVWWEGSANAFIVIDQGRAAQTIRVLAVDASGTVTELLHESSDTQAQLGPVFFKTNLTVLPSGEVVYWSERTGWGHLYLRRPDGTDTAVTSGEWQVRELVGVDSDTRTAWFTAAGRESDLDPYARQLYSAHLDTGQVRRLTHDHLDHELQPSPSGLFAVDTASWVDEPGHTVLRALRRDDVLELATADATDLLSAGWRAPERFEVLAADGQTTLHGLLYQPAGFDSRGSYPVLDDIYPGPQLGPVCVRFPGTGGMNPAAHAASMAALGFAVVVLDARGTTGRGKQFQEASRADRDELLADHAAAIRQLASTRPWLDLARVGLYGHSGGGWATVRGLLTHPELFKVGVASSGNHDDAMYHAMWGERFFGPADVYDYQTASNGALVDRLEGKLLLIHGELDDNVTPHLTMRLVDAFMAADKDVDVLIVPNGDHTLMTHEHHWFRRRWDFLVRHLMGSTPPAVKLAPIEFDIELLADAFG